MNRLTLCIVLAALFIAVHPLHAQSDRSLMRDGNSAYDGKKFSDAEVSYRKAMEKNKEVVNGSFNLGDALYKQDRFSEAAEQYKNAAAKAMAPADRAEAMHNLGNALLKDKKYEESIAAYKEALKLNSKDDDTRYNYEFAKAMLQKQQQQKQNKDQNKKDDKKDDKKDQQKQDQQKKDQQKQDQQKQDQQKQDQQQQGQDQQKQAQQRKQQISKQDAERILEALKNQEQKVQAKLHKVKVAAPGQVAKDW